MFIEFKVEKQFLCPDYRRLNILKKLEKPIYEYYFRGKQNWFQRLLHIHAKWVFRLSSKNDLTKTFKEQYKEIK